MAFEGGRMADLFDPDLADEAVREMALEAGAFATARARELAPVRSSEVNIPGRAPGTLRDSYRQSELRRERAPMREGWSSGVESSDFVARLLEHGVAPHEIRGRRGRLLRFRAASGEMVTARVVQHPGVRGRHIVGNALADTRLAFEELAQPALVRWAKRAARAAR